MKDERFGPEFLMEQFLAQMSPRAETPEMRETPSRYTKYLRDFLARDHFKMTTFDSEGMDEMVVQTGIPFVSLCAHHTLPFFGTGAIGYIPNGKIVGLSKLARTLDYFSRDFQNQERLTKQVAEFLAEKIQPKGVAVSLRATHSCMVFRGIKAFGSETVTTWLTGAFREDSRTRAEFLQAVR